MSTEELTGGRLARSPGGPPPSFWQRLRHVHPGLILAVLDSIGIVIASYLSYVEINGEVPYCGPPGSPLSGCEQVALSQYSRVNGIPVAVFGVLVSATLLVLALSWWRTGDRRLLAGHYLLSLAAVIFESWFTWLELFVIQAICVYCVTYFISLLLRFLVTLAVWIRTPANKPASG